VALRAFLNAAAVLQAGGLGAACQYFAQISNEELAEQRGFRETSILTSTLAWSLSFRHLDVNCHFVLVHTTTSVPPPVTVERGNALERIVLRMFGRKTEKVEKVKSQKSKVKSQK
jgi:hypothetical protein